MAEPVETPYWLTQYDVERSWDPVAVHFLNAVSIGDRSDFRWAEVRPRVLDHRRLVLLGVRHQGESLDTPTRWPVHVYVCTVTEDDEQADALTKDQVTIAAWGLLHRSRESALTDTY